MFSFFLTLSSLVIVLISSSLSLLEYLDTNEEEIKKALDKGYKKLSDLTKTKYDVITEEELNRIVPTIKTDASGEQHCRYKTA